MKLTYTKKGNFSSDRKYKINQKFKKWLAEQDEEQRMYIEGFLKFAQKGQVIANVRHISKSGMSRVIDFSYPHKGEIRPVPRLLLDQLGYKWNYKHWGYKVNGCGMDMIFSLLSNLGYFIFEANETCRAYDFFDYIQN